MSGYTVNYLDIAPRYASLLMGFSKGIATFAGVLGTLYHHHHDLCGFHDYLWHAMQPFFRQASMGKTMGKGFPLKHTLQINNAHVYFFHLFI